MFVKQVGKEQIRGDGENCIINLITENFQQILLVYLL
jgi:hypothetical protein